MNGEPRDFVNPLKKRANIPKFLEEVENLPFVYDDFVPIKPEKYTDVMYLLKLCCFRNAVMPSFYEKLTKIQTDNGDDEDQ